MDLPNDVKFKIMGKMDIDTRRALGIYTKLRIPKNISDKINSVFIRPDPLYISETIHSFSIKIKINQTEKYYVIVHTVYAPKSFIAYATYYSTLNVHVEYYESDAYEAFGPNS